MRIVVVAPYLSVDGSYGGPVAVAVDHAAALIAAGHDVVLACGWDGRAEVTSPAEVRLFRARRPLRRSFVGLVAPGLRRWVARQEADVVHVHLTRDLVTLPVAATVLRRGVPLVLQTHGQIRSQRSWPQALLDLFLTRRVLTGAGALLSLTPHEEADLQALGAPAGSLQRIDNGVPATTHLAVPPGDRPLVLFSARLAERKRPLAFVAMAQLVHDRRPDVQFELWGPDGGEVTAVQDAINRAGLSDVCGYRGAVTVDRARANLARAAVYLLPSRAEPFPMALLEAFSAGLPAVITDRTGLSRTAQEAGAAAVTDGSPGQMAAAVVALLDDPERWAAVSAAARELAGERFAMERIAERLDEVYAGVIMR